MEPQGRENKGIIMMKEYLPQKNSTKNLDINLPLKNNEQFKSYDNRQAPAEESLQKNLQIAEERINEKLEEKKKEYDKNYNKSETVSLMTKYQMIFVKIEIYLINFAHIFQAKTQPDLKIAFERIKERVRDKQEHNARVSILYTQLLKSRLGDLSFVFKKKEQNYKMAAFVSIKHIWEDKKLSTEIGKIRTSQVNELRALLSKKKKEFEDAAFILEETKSRKMGASRKSQPTAVTHGMEFDSSHPTSLDVKKLIKMISKEKEAGKKLKSNLKATEESLLSFIQEINQILGMHEDFFKQNKTLEHVWKEFESQIKRSIN